MPAKVTLFIIGSQSSFNHIIITLRPLLIRWPSLARGKLVQVFLGQLNGKTGRRIRQATSSSVELVDWRSVRSGFEKEITEVRLDYGLELGGTCSSEELKGFLSF